MEHQVIWKEGTFILPQHFQQQERFFLNQIFRHLSTTQPYFWGIERLTVNEMDLERGIFSLERLSGCFQDGTSFVCPSANQLPANLNLSEADSNSVIYVTLPIQSATRLNVSFENSDETQYRLIARESSVLDTTNNEETRSQVIVGDLNLTLTVQSRTQEASKNTLNIPVAKVKEVIGSRISLCSEFIPVITDISQSKRLTHFVVELLSMFTSRADSLSHRVSGSGRTTGVTEYSEFLLLQLINRVEPYLKQLSVGIPCHPHDLYIFLVTLAGELSTFMKAKRRPPDFPIYNHNELTECFDFVLSDINSSFNVVLEQRAVQIELSKPKNGIRAARLNHKELLRNSTIILAVAASVPEENLREELPAQIKIGPGEKIFSLIQSAVPGIKINLLSHVPPELPYRSGYCYFQLDKNSGLWPELEESKGLAIHVSGNYPELVMELWALKQK